VSIYSKLIEIENSNRKAVLCTITTVGGSAPRKAGAKMLVYQDGSIAGTIGGGSLEKEVIRQALEALKHNSPIVVKHNLVKELGMCCGGTVELFIEPVMNKKKLYIFGAGHIGKSLAHFSSQLDFNVTLIDERYEMFEGIDTSAISILQENHFTAIEHLDFDENTFVVILTHNHAYDREILAITSQKQNGYIGMIGSQRKVEIAKKNLSATAMVAEKELEEIDMPIGIDINAITPQEIAISILAKLIAKRNESLKKQKKTISQI
jgi:xanthine dehydrogenase accessory factor